MGTRFRSLQVCGLIYVAASISACGGKAPRPQSARPAKQAPLPAPAGIPRAIARTDVIETVDAGLGALLSHFSLEPTFEQGAFVGYRIVGVFPEGYMRGVVKPGDIVLEANGRGVENPNEVYEGFESLRTAKELHVILQREGERQQLRLPITDLQKRP